MPYSAQPQELRLALLSLFTVADRALDGGACARVLDAATEAASTAPVEIAGSEDTAKTRFGAARVLNSLCAACRLCPRGRAVETAVIAPPLRQDP